MDKKTAKIICTAFSSGKKHDFRLLKESRVYFHPVTLVVNDTGYLGLQKIHPQTLMPKKKSKKHPLTKEEKRQNRQISSDRVLNEHVIGKLKRFKIIADKYRNRRKRFCLRFNLIAGIYNSEFSGLEKLIV